MVCFVCMYYKYIFYSWPGLTSMYTCYDEVPNKENWIDLKIFKWEWVVDVEEREKEREREREREREMRNKCCLIDR